MNHAETTLVQSWSTDRDEESYSYKSFNEAPVLKLSDWTSAWQWSSQSIEIVKFKTDDSETYFCMPAGEEKTLSRKYCKLYFNRVEQANWTSFDEYAKHVSKINYIEYDKIIGSKVNVVVVTGLKTISVVTLLVWLWLRRR